MSESKIEGPSEATKGCLLLICATIWIALTVVMIDDYKDLKKRVDVLEKAQAESVKP